MLLNFLLIAGYIAALAKSQCVNATQRYGDFYYSVHAPAGNPTVCKRTFFPPERPKNTALLLKILHVYYKSAEVESIVAPDGKEIPYVRRNYYGSRRPAWCGVYVEAGSPCKERARLTDSCSRKPTASQQWPPVLTINSTTHVQLLMTYAFISCPEIPRNDTRVKTSELRNYLSRCKTGDYSLNSLSLIFLVVFVAVACLAASVFIVKHLGFLAGPKKTFTPKVAPRAMGSVMRLQLRDPERTSRRKRPFPNEVVSSTSFSFMSMQRPDTANSNGNAQDPLCRDDDLQK